MKKLAAVLSFLVCLAATVDFGCADGFGGFGFIQLTLPQRAAPPPSPVPTLIAGTNAPMGQTPAMPSVSTEVPRCLDATWGAGCNVATQKCITPTTGSPYQPCQPPQMLVTTGGTSNGTTGQILYTSYASATYPVGEAIIIGGQAGAHQATQANWNTPKSQVTAFASSASNGACPASGPSVTLTINDTTAANPYATSGPASLINVGGVTSGSVPNQYQSFGWTQGNPNGAFTVVAAGGSTGAWTITYCTAVQVTGTLQLNLDHYSGVVTTPYIATSSNCNISGNPFSCQVSFLNPHTCASNCVSSDTQFIAGQFDDLILNHHFGEQVPLSEQNGTVEPCAIASHISGTSANPAFFAYAELDGGALVKTSAITDPRGTGASGLSAPPKKVYCAQFAAGAVSDGEHEVSWIACPIVGYCARLQSIQSIDAASSSSTFFKANNHALVGGSILGIAASPDANFPVFDWTQSTLRSISGIGSAPNVSSLSISGGSITYNFTASNIVGQFKAGSTVGISGLVTGNSCTVASGSQNGSALTLNLAGTCNFPTNSSVNIAGISTVPNGNLLNSCPITGGSIAAGVVTLTYSGACSFPVGEQFTVSGLTPSGLNGLQTITVSSAGTIKYATAATGTVTFTSAAITANGLTWSGTIVKVSSGGACPGTCSIQVPSLSTMSFNGGVGGTVTANLNGQCVISSSSSGQIVCPTLADASTTRVSGGSISSTANLFCAPGGNGDDPAPYDPAGGTEVQQFFPDSFQLIPYVASPATCGVRGGQTGCFGATCGRLPSQQETLWVTRFEAGIDEREVFNSNMPKLETGSYFVYTDAGGSAVHQSVWVDSWNASAVKTGCYSSATPCGDLSHALYALQATSSNSGNAPGNQTLTNQAVTNCLVFSNAGNISGAIPLYDGEAVNFVGFDSNTSAQLSQFGLYWIVGAGSSETGNANGVILAPTLGGSCITDTASGIFGGFTNIASTAWLFNDVGGDHIYLACNTTLASPQVPCSSAHPETYDWKVVTTAAATAPIYARASYLNIGPDVTNGVTHDQVSVLNGTGVFFSGAAFAAQGGRIHKTADTTDKELSLTPAVALGPTLPITTVTGGSLATCPAPNAAHQCETLSFVAHKNPATQVADGSTFQAPTATNPLGQAILVSGVVSSTSLSCAVTSASNVSGVSFTLNFTPGGACAAFTAGNAVNIAGVVLAANGVSWNGSNLIPLSVTASSITMPTTSTTAYSSGGTITADWNCGLSIATTCGFNGATPLTSNLVAATPTSVTLINDNANGTWVSGGKITPVDLVVEFAPNTFTNNPCATDGIPNDTHSFLTCISASTVTAGTPNWLGTNSTSFPISINGTTLTSSSTSPTRNSNCNFVAHTGENPVVGSQAIQAIIPATGGNNDVILLSFSSAATFPYYAFNQCDALFFANSVFAPSGTVTDMWFDSETMSGPGPYSDFLGSAGVPAVSAAFYQTNGTRQSTIHSFDGSTYTWGGHSQYAMTGCINATLEAISNKCNNIGQSVVPFALGGNLNADGTQWTPILGSLDASGNNVQCGGVDCVSTATVTLKVAQGTIPFYAGPGWGLEIMCNMPTTGGPPLNSNTTLMDNGSQISYLNNNTSPATLTTPAASIAGTCNISSHPALYFANFDHIDFDFNTFGPSLLPTSGNRGAWQTYNSAIQENNNAPNMGTEEGWAYQGGTIFNFALEDMFMGLSQAPVPTQFPFVTVGPGNIRGMFNVILRNDFMGTYVAGSAAGTYAGPSPWNDIFIINDSGGNAQTNFPGSGLSDWTQTSFWNGTGNSVTPQPGETAIGGMATNYTAWPTGTRGVDPATGLPNVASAPFYNSMTAAPWYGILGDTGLGTQ